MRLKNKKGEESKVLLHNSYYYFSTHTINQSIYSRLQASVKFESLSEQNKEVMLKLVDTYSKRDRTIDENPMDFCSRFIKSHREEVYDLVKQEGYGLKSFMTLFLGFSNLWGASTRSFGKTSTKRAELIEEEELISEMTNDKSSSIKKLLDSGGFNLQNVKPFLPAIMISLDTNSRNKSLMKYKHTGRFSFDFDGFKDKEDARKWLNKIWNGTKNLNPYMGFISPRGKGVKIFCRIDKSDKTFIDDFKSEDRSVVMKHHKEWYEGAKKEWLSTYPDLKSNFDESTKDLQRLTYIPFITSPEIDFKYDKTKISSYINIVKSQRNFEKKIIKEKILSHKKEIEEIMKDSNIKSKEDALHLLLKNNKPDFDLDYELDKFIKVVDFIEDLATKDNRVYNWVSEKFNDYSTLHKISWVLFGVFGDLAIDQIKRLIPDGSNKLDENHTDYRWSVRSKSDYDEEVLNVLTPAAFYSLVMELGEVRDYISETFKVNSSHVNDFKMLNSYYETYKRNLDLYIKDDNSGDLNEFLDNVTKYVDKKKIRLPLIKELEDLQPDVILGPGDYLDKATMTNIYQNKYKEKRIFSLRSQCGTGKNTLAGNPKYKLKGRVILSEPYKSISDQAASEAWENGDRNSQMFVNSAIETTLLSFKKTDKEAIKVNFENSLKDAVISDDKELVIHTTYNQIMNLSFEDLETFDYIFIDESHTLSEGLTYRSDVISGLLSYLVEFISRKRKSKTKIIFMSGTPNVETHVIPELMDEYNIKNLFQRIIINKSYKRSPIVHLNHLDTTNPEDRQNAVIKQINKYIKQGRKVCHIFNNKSKMDQYIRDIQTKLSDNIKVGLFYSGSSGECTRNILAGKMGDYDVILATTYFINGINIEKDGLTEEDIKNGVESLQKYGVIIDLGQNHTKVSAMDAVQTINRFRNRLCNATVFLPKIFKEDPYNPSRPFGYNHAAKVLLGLNRYNSSYLSLEQKSDENNIQEIDEELEELKEKVLLLESVKKNPLLVSSADLDYATKKEEQRSKIFSLISKKLRVYEDWFNSLDGYHFLAKDAGFVSIIKNTIVPTDLKAMTSKHIDLENKVLENFMNDDIALKYLSNQLDPDKRILVKSSGKIKDPENTSVSNFSVVKLINNKYIIEGDFHISHERSLNNIIKNHLRLSYLYDTDTSIKIIRALMDNTGELIPGLESHHGVNISKYVAGCKNASNKSMRRAYGFLKSLDLLYESTYPGISKYETETYTTYSINEESLVEEVYMRWASIQYETMMYKIDLSDSKDKEILKKYYSNKNLVMDYDIEELQNDLKSLGIYKKLRKNKAGEVIKSEQIHIPKVLRSKKIEMMRWEDDISEWESPEVFTKTDYESYINNILINIIVDIAKLSNLLTSIDQSLSYNIDKNIIDKIKKGKLGGLHSAKYYAELYKNSATPSKYGKQYSTIKSKLDIIYHKINSIESILNKAFKYGEYFIFKEYGIHGKTLFGDNILLTKEGFDMDSIFRKDYLEENPSPKNINSILDCILNDLNNDISSIRGDKKYIVALKKTNVVSQKPIGDTDITISEKNITNYEAVASGTTKSKFAERLCLYAYKNGHFITSGGVLPINFNKGPYNKNTFLRDYYINQIPGSNKKILNYEFISIKLKRSDLKKRLKENNITS